MKYYKLSEYTLRDLLIDKCTLAMLEANGVDNWIGYFDNHDRFVADMLMTDGITEEDVRERDLQLSDVADALLEDFEVLGERN